MSAFLYLEAVHKAKKVCMYPLRELGTPITFTDTFLSVCIHSTKLCVLKYDIFPDVEQMF